MAATIKAKENEDLVRRFAETVVNEANYDRIDEFVAEDVYDYTPFGEREGRDAMIETTKEVRAAFPDLAVEFEEVVATGDIVAVLMRQRGTHEGEFMGIAPTGKAFDIEAMAFARLRDGKIVERRVRPDVLGLLAQIGVRELPRAEKPGT